MGREVNQNCSLEYFPPSIDSNGLLYASIPRSEILLNVDKWNNTLIGYVLGDKPFYTHLKGCVGRLWKLKCSLEIYSRENERELLNSVPVWIRLPALHLKLWSNNIIGRIASIVGKPLYIDQATASGERLAYARCFVEISSKAKLPNYIRMDLGNGDWLETAVEYEWIPPKCVKCQNFGHVDHQCPVVIVEKWVAKTTLNETGFGESMIKHNEGLLNEDAVINKSQINVEATNNGSIIHAINEDDVAINDVLSDSEDFSDRELVSHNDESQAKKDKLNAQELSMKDKSPYSDTTDTLETELPHKSDSMNKVAVNRNNYDFIHDPQQSVSANILEDIPGSSDITVTDVPITENNSEQTKNNAVFLDSLQSDVDNSKEKGLDFTIAVDNPDWITEKDQLIMKKKSQVKVNKDPSETKVKSAKAYRITKCIPAHWSFCNNYFASDRGRIWVVWDSDIWNGDVLSATLQVITIRLQNKGGFNLLLSVIYGENSESARLSLWADIRDIYDKFKSMPWLLVGDFNVCRFTTEKIGGRHLTVKKLQDFNDCIQSCGLSDIKSTGSLWTWHNKQQGQGRIYGKLDRGLGNTKLFDQFPQAFIEYKSTSTSDHTLALLHLTPKLQSGPKPFRFFNFWMQCQGYEEILRCVWNKHYTGSPMFILVSKLKDLKLTLKQWTNQSDVSPKANIMKLKNKLDIIQQKLNQDFHNEDLQDSESAIIIELDGWLCREEEEMRHIIAQNGSHITSNDNIKHIAASFYEDLFNQTSYWNVFPKLTVKRILTAESKQWLVQEVNYKEIRNALFQMNADKAPGPDGFNAYFYQQNWNMISGDVVLAVQSFFKSGTILKQINHTFLTLVPKSKEATSIQDYRPISCCNVIYKIITKILANRLKMVIGELISKNQHAFLQGRHIGECSLLAHELLRDFNRNHGKRACFKIDLHKAFDSINREFVYYVMHCMGFPVKWISWIRACLSTPSFSVLLNGSSSGFFKSNRGIRQGDPLSPYIFVMVMEFWSIGMELAVISGKIQNFKTQHDLQVSHILFADDMLVFCRANKKSFEGINNLLDTMALNTGLCINRKKSKLYFSKGCNCKGVLSSIVGISIGTLPMKYLGLPLSAKYPKTKDFLPLIDKVRHKIEGWMSHSLSFAGRLELIKSVLFSTSAYWYFVYKFPHSIIQNLESIFANFLWSGQFHAINWKEVCRPKQEGGFGLRRLKDLSQAAALKLIWRLLTANSLWTNWMNVRYIRGDNFWESNTNLLDSGTWKHISSLKNQALKCIMKSIGNGETTSLWFDPWLQEGRIIELLHYLTPQHTDTTTWTFQVKKINGYGCIQVMVISPFLQLGIKFVHPMTNLSFTMWYGSQTQILECLVACSEVYVTAYIWKLCKLKLQMKITDVKDLKTEALEIQQKFKKKDNTYILARLALNATVWHIWQERNKRIFHDQKLHKIMVFRRIYEDINILLRTCNWKVGNSDILSNWSYVKL
ncbi:uncharacterized protein LOC109835211 [Asparagus officinalis]|uniref:uncharacterized protein LOC109835211 n=1 Tax=Asparagus officinalis TaxID=4686 RepID=UPI00098E3A06|nr:uncharacterized protein LOC109835211 [Asparagus officinalis]